MTTSRLDQLRQRIGCRARYRHVGGHIVFKQLLEHIRAGDVMQPGPVTVRPSDGLAKLLAAFVGHPGGPLVVTDQDDRLLA